MSIPSDEETARNSLGFAKIDREPLHERVYAEIRKVIMSGALEPGAAVTIRSLADAVGTSTMPVRDAVRRLVAERALEVRANRTIALPRLTAERYEEIVRIRIALEGMAADMAAERISPAGLVRLRELEDEMEQRGVVAPDYLRINQEFHFTIYAAAEQPVLLGIIESLWLQIGPMLNHVRNIGGYLPAVENHHAMIVALQSGNGEAARKAIASDITDAAALVVKALERKDASDASAR